jgi:MFS family permease
VLSALPFTLAIIMLGLSAALFGTKLDTNGPRWAMATSSLFFVAGFLISAAGVAIGQYWLVIVGYGFVGGIGLGIGYISPVSTLIKWFPDRPGLSTGIAIMGFGGGALIATPLTNQLLTYFGGTGDGGTAGGVAATFLTMGLIYAVFMSVGWLLIRVPADDWHPAGWDPDTAKKRPLVTTANVSANNAIKTPQFWLLWVVLCFNVTAGIGILERAQGIYSDFFPDASSPRALLAAAGGVRRDAVTGQRDRPDPLVVHLGLPRAQEHVPDLPRRGRADVPRRRGLDELEQGRLPRRVHGHPVVLRRRVLHRAGLPA